MTYIINKSLMTALARILSISVVMALVLIGTAVGEISRTGLVGEWHFDGDTKDSSGNVNDINLFNGTEFAEGKFGKALSFDGVNDYAETSSIINLYDRSFTFEVWYKNPEVKFQGYTDIIGNYKTSTIPTAQLFIAGTSTQYTGKAGFNIRDPSRNNVDIFSTNRIDNNQWHHIAGVRDTTTGKMYLYIDGVLDNQSDSSSIGIVDSGQKFIIGSGSLDRYTNAIVDEVRIYNRALSADEVKTIYEAGQIIINSSPSGAEVLIDGISRGTASPTLTVSGIAPGSHAVKCKLSGYSDYDTNVALTSGSVAPINCTLTPPTPPITPTSTPTVTPTPTPTITPTSTPTITLTSTPTITSTAIPISLPPLSNTLKITLASDPPSVEPGQKSTIIVTVTGSNGTGISGVDVMLDSPSAGKLDPASGTTNPFGRFTSTFTASTNGNAGVEARIEAIVKKEGFQDGKGNLTLAVISEPSLPQWLWIILILVIILTLVILYLWIKGNLKLIPKQTSIPCDGKSTLPIKVQFVNAFGKPRTQKKDCEIEMETSSGTIQNVVIPAGKEFIDAILTSSTECGPVMITATSGKQKRTAQVNLVCNEACLDVEISPATIPADGKSTATVIIRIKDDKGNYITSLNERVIDMTTTIGTITSPVKIPPRSKAGIATITSGQISGTAKVIASCCSPKGEGKALYGEGKVAFAELAKRYCMHCGTPMTIDALSCPKCGKIPISDVDTKQCSTCGKDIPLSAKYCDKCGARQAM